MSIDPGKHKIFIIIIFILACIVVINRDARAVHQKNAQKKNSLLKEWFEGPVRYIITKDEEKIFKSLETDQQRAAFINRFWSRRDPTPGTPENEFRYEFWERVVNANFLFAESTKPGWKTDRGKVYIIMGPANEIEEDPDLSRQGSNASNAYSALTRWTYQGTGRTDLDPIIIIAFTKNADGEYHLSNDPDLNSVFYDRLGSYYRPTAENLTKEFRQTSVSELAVTLDLGKIQQLPPKEEVFTAIVTDKEYFGAIPLKTAVSVYSREPGGEILAILSLAFKKKDVPTYNLKIAPKSTMYIVARLVDQNDPSIFINFPEGSFTPSPFNDSAGVEGFLHYQLRTRIPPGSYNLLVGIFDSASEYIGSHREPIEIPALKEKALTLSDITIAERIEQKEAGTPVQKDEPFWFGDLCVIPRAENELKRGEMLTLFFQVSFAPAATYLSEHPDLKNEFKLHGTYQFFMKNTNGEYVQIGKPLPFDVTEPFSMKSFIVNKGRSFDTTSWPAGNFKVTVSITDEATQETDSRDAFFSID